MKLQYQVFKPDPRLQTYVKYYWMMMDPIGSEVGKSDLLIPDGQTEIIFNAHSVYSRSHLSSTDETLVKKSSIIGQRNRSLQASRKGQNELIGVKLQPGALYLITGIPEKEFKNSIISFEDISKVSSLKRTEELLFKTQSVVERVALLNLALLKMVSPNNDINSEIIQRIISDIQKSEHEESLSSIGAKYQIHPKKLDRLFDKYVGLSPKNYLKINRFKKAYKAFNRSKVAFYDPSIYSLGYYDQTHFIKEFKEYTHQTPSDYYSHSAKTSDDIMLNTMRQLKTV